MRPRSPSQSLPLTGVRLIAYALMTSLLLAGGLAVRSDAAAPSGLSADPAHGDDVRGGGVRADDRHGDDPAAVEALRRAANAELNVAYRGTQFVSIWHAGTSQTFMVDLANSPGYGTSVKLHGDPVTEATFVSRTGEDQVSPAADPAGNRPAAGPEAAGTRRDAGEARDAQVGRSGELTGILDSTYVLTMAGSGNSTGRPAEIVEAARKDGRVAARFWLDRASGLLLRRELYAPDGRLARASGFVDLEIGGDGFLGHLPPVLPSEAADPQAPASYSRLAAAGWDCCRKVLAGLLRLSAVRLTSDGSTLHLAYSDGLTVTSVFQQRGRLDATALKGFTRRQAGNGDVYVRYGLSSSAIWSAEGLVYTVVSDTAYGLDHAVAALPHEQEALGDENSVGQRLDRGMAKIVSWLNPFG